MITDKIASRAEKIICHSLRRLHTVRGLFRQKQTPCSRGLLILEQINFETLHPELAAKSRSFPKGKAQEKKWSQRMFNTLRPFFFLQHNHCRKGGLAAGGLMPTGPKPERGVLLFVEKNIVAKKRINYFSLPNTMTC